MGIQFPMLVEGEVPLDFESDWIIGTTWTTRSFPGSLLSTGQERSGVQRAGCTLNVIPGQTPYWMAAWNLPTDQAGILRQSSQGLRFRIKVRAWCGRHRNSRVSSHRWGNSCILHPPDIPQALAPRTLRKPNTMNIP